MKSLNKKGTCSNKFMNKTLYDKEMTRNMVNWRIVSVNSLYPVLKGYTNNFISFIVNI